MRRAVLSFLALVLVAASGHPAYGAPPPGPTPTWTRTVAPAPDGATDDVYPVAIALPLADGTIVVRNGAGAAAVDPRGKTLWSMPDVLGAIALRDAVIFRRSTVVFAVRARDSGLLWKRPCARPRYLGVAGTRIATSCGDVSTILDARDGRVVARHTIGTTAPSELRAARPLNRDFVLVTGHFDGAWMGESYDVVDVRTGAFVVRYTDIDVLDVTPATMTLTQYPSMLPWAPGGFVERIRLADGKKVGEKQYAVPAADTSRAQLAQTPAATYVITMDGLLYRYPGRRTTKPERVLPERVRAVTALGDTAFVLTDGGQVIDGTVYADRPATNGRFATRRLGPYAGVMDVVRPDRGDVVYGYGVRVGDRVAVADHSTVRFYDQLGTVRGTVSSPCSRSTIAATRTDVILACNQPDRSQTISAFALRTW